MSTIDPTIAYLVEQINMQLGNIAEDINKLEHRIKSVEKEIGPLRESNDALRMKIEELENG